MNKPPIAVFAETISEYLGDTVNCGELAHKILAALELDHTLPVTPNRHLAPWNNERLDPIVEQRLDECF